MALIVDPQSNLKHYFCKICKKGFGCGRALGGHMRAHGIGDENGQTEEEEEEYQASDWESDKEKGRNIGSSKCMYYSLRTNPNRLKSCRVCNNCGKEFLCWKSFLDHGKCTTLEYGDSLVSPPDDGSDGTPMRSGCGWSKRKRSFRAKVGNFISNYSPSNEEEDLAICLMMLSNGAVDPLVADHQEESCASASKDEDSLILSAPSKYYYRPITHPDKSKGVVANKALLFQCKACKKVFNSHQALGGHRASHKKVKGCFAARLDHDHGLGGDEDAIVHDEFLPTKSTSNFQTDQYCSLTHSKSSKKKAKVHDCSICHRVFSTGQALGGHKRCHWITSNTTTPHPSTSSPSMAMADKLHHLQGHLEQIQLRPKFTVIVSKSDPLDLTLDLNLPAASDDQAEPHGPAWMGVDGKDKSANCYQIEDGNNNNNNNNNKNNNNLDSPIHNVEDEKDSKAKLAKLSDPKDLNMNGSWSPWLQVGLGSTTDVAVDP